MISHSINLSLLLRSTYKYSFWILLKRFHHSPKWPPATQAWLLLKLCGDLLPSAVKINSFRIETQLSKLLRQTCQHQYLTRSLVFLSLLSFPRPHCCLLFVFSSPSIWFICCSDLPSFVLHIYGVFVLIVSFGPLSSLHRPQTCVLCLVAGDIHSGLKNKFRKLFIKLALTTSMSTVHIPAANLHSTFPHPASVILKLSTF